MPLSAVPTKLLGAELSPEELVHYCQQTLPEDSRGFELLVARYKGLVFKTAYRLMGNREDADDQAQEIFLKIYRGIRHIDNPRSLTTWVYRITVNTCLDALRKEKRNPLPAFRSTRDTPEDERGEIELRDTRTPTPEEAVVQSETIQCLEETMAQLEPTNRAILTLREIEDRPYDEIAKILDLRLSAVKMRIHRARLLFQQLLGRICPDLYRYLSESTDRNQLGG